MHYTSLFKHRIKCVKKINWIALKNELIFSALEFFCFFFASRQKRKHYQIIKKTMGQL
jgi:hypothetical protein